ncbi:sensor histidine kinase [Gottfriedia solisilvae]|uniref:Histidine kinase n=1 Tax=Gottfriedia solisilvae TaxID=1516104 RepID=A0A8J3EZL8_9BACI|nr:sensor histidine kinase [Gottfriedia solisilvae]GGI15427.1 histidine kinase [Gottfriedia solisilvae]
MKRKRLKVQIAYTYIIISLLTLLIIGSLLYYLVSNLILKESIQSTKSSVKKSGTYIEMYLDKLKNVSDLIIENNEVKDFIKNGNKKSEINAMRFLNVVKSSDSYIKSILIVSKDGKVLSNERDLSKDMNSNMMEESWYVSAIKSNNTPFHSSLRLQKFPMKKNNWVISMSREVKGVNNKHLGVLLIDIEYKVIEDYLNEIYLGKKGFAFILNSKEEVVYHKDPTYFGNKKKREYLVKIKDMKEGYTRSKNVLTEHYKVKNADWLIIGISFLDELSKFRNQLIITIILVGILMLLIIIISSTLLANRITKPIYRLEHLMKVVEKGDFNIDFTESTNGSIEVFSLSKHFHKMVLEIKNLLVEIEEKEKNVRIHELSVLHSQINPHFLYNTLDTIVWMTEFEEKERVISITKALAKFFQLSLSGGNEFTTIQNEIEHVKQYLFIQKERYGEKLSYSIDYNPALNDVKIPKILLQPIVENAIYHGIRESDENGEITIRLEKDHKDILFFIQDNGIGFDTTKLNAINKMKTAKLGGIGISNVNKRIKLYYGESYGISIQSIIGKGTKVMIRIKTLKSDSI